MTRWRPDVLGDEFECTDIDLGEDTEGPLVATLVRALPGRLGFWDRLFDYERDLEHADVLYVHGWSDYFFQKPLARFFTERGARFFALDLRKYGRSLLDGQTHGYIEHLERYDEEIGAAIEIIRGEAGADAAVAGVSRVRGRSFSTRIAKPRKLILLGHSTGGLVLSLWAHRNRGIADALVLNSPWLDLQLPSAARIALSSVVNLRARLNPHEITLPQLDFGFYAQAQAAASLPEEMAALNRQWRPEHSPPVRAAWLKAILAGHNQVRDGIDVGMPACVLLSARTEFGMIWDDNMQRADTVLEVDSVARAALKIGPSVTIERIDGALHDIFLSAPEVRAEAYKRLNAWLLGWRAASRMATQDVRADASAPVELPSENPSETPVRGSQDHSSEHDSAGEK